MIIQFRRFISPALSFSSSPPANSSPSIGLLSLQSRVNVIVTQSKLSSTEDKARGGKEGASLRWPVTETFHNDALCSHRLGRCNNGHLINQPRVLWIRNFRQRPKRIFLIPAVATLRQRLPIARKAPKPISHISVLGHLNQGLVRTNSTAQLSSPGYSPPYRIPL